LLLFSPHTSYVIQRPNLSLLFNAAQAGRAAAQEALDALTERHAALSDEVAELRSAAAATTVGMHKHSPVVVRLPLSA
jgi:hypothetical protein